MASHDSSRKKRKATHMDGQTSQLNNPPVIASSSKLPLPPINFSMDNKTAANASCHHEQSLKALNTDLDAMRQLVTCKICDRLLYEPYALSCGHTYCYSCLSQWLGGNAKMTCPDCRTVIRQQPTPSYLIRELVLVFVSRNELLPDGETADEHNKLVREEAEVVAKDKANEDPRTGGLFKGRFNRGRLNVLGPLHDAGDGVDRCPACMWELEDGHCNSCGFELDDVDDDFSADESDMVSVDDEDLDVDHELRDMDDDDMVYPDDFAFDAQFVRERDGNNIHTAARRWPQYGPPVHAANPGNTIELLESEDDSEEDEYDPNDTFIDDGPAEELSDASDAESDVTAGRPAGNRAHARRLLRQVPVVISDDEDEDGDVRVVHSRGPAARLEAARRRHTPVALLSDNESEGENGTAASTTQGVEEEEEVDSSSSDSEDDEPVVRGSQRNKRNVAVRSRRAPAVSSDEESESDQDEGTAHGGFSPIDEGLEDEGSDHTDYDDDGYAGDATMGLAAPSFDPEDDASAGGYDDDEESDDGWGTTTTTDRSAALTRPAPSARLGTLQQRRARHVSPLQRPQRTIRSPTDYALGRAADHSLAYAIPYAGAAQHQRLPVESLVQSIRRITDDPNFANVRAPQQQQQRQQTQAPNHPFNLGDVLARINGPQDDNVRTTPHISKYNRRSQQA